MTFPTPQKFASMRSLPHSPFNTAPLYKQKRDAISRSSQSSQQQTSDQHLHNAKTHKQWHHHAIANSAAAATATAALAAFLTLTPYSLPPSSSAVTNEQLLFLESWRAVDRAYVEKKFNGQNWFKVREDALKNKKMTTRTDTYTAIKSLLSSLGDPFTRFLEPDQYDALRRSTAGSVTGVGVEVSFTTTDKNKGSTSPTSTSNNNPLVVISPAPGGPAERAGIKPQDEIIAIDDAPIRELSLYAIGNLLQGPEGSQVTLKVKPHNANGSIKDITLTRQPISFNPVEVAVCPTSGYYAPSAPQDSKLGYIRISTFNKQTAEKVREAILALSKQQNAGGGGSNGGGNGVDRIVMDIRNNGGGLFPAGVEVARMLIERGDIVFIADSEGIRDIYEAERTSLDTSTPITVLANRGTASASEVLAGALKDNKRAQIAGENTFGKGLIQTLIELSDGSAVAVTVAKYQTPAGVDINKVGITPDIVLGADVLATLPFHGEEFCKYGGIAEAPKLFS